MYIHKPTIFQGALSHILYLDIERKVSNVYANDLTQMNNTIAFKLGDSRIPWTIGAVNIFVTNLDS